MFNKWLPYPACMLFVVVAGYLNSMTLGILGIGFFFFLWFRMLNEATSSKNGYLFIFALIGWPILFIGLSTLK